MGVVGLLVGGHLLDLPPDVAVRTSSFTCTAVAGDAGLAPRVVRVGSATDPDVERATPGQVTSPRIEEVTSGDAMRCELVLAVTNIDRVPLRVRGLRTPGLASDDTWLAPEGLDDTPSSVRTVDGTDARWSIDTTLRPGGTVRVRMSLGPTPAACLVERGSWTRPSVEVSLLGLRSDIDCGLVIASSSPGSAAACQQGWAPTE